MKLTRDMLGGVLDLRELTVSDIMVHRTKMDAIDVELPAEQDRRPCPEKLAYPRAAVARRARGDRRHPARQDLLRALRDAKGDLGQARHHGVGRAALVRARHHHAQGSAQRLPQAQGAFRHRGRRVWRGAWAWSRSRTSSRRSSATSPTRPTSPRALAKPQPDGSLIVDGVVPIRDVNRLMDWDMPDEEATTIAGLVIHEAQTIPNPGQAFTFHDYPVRGAEPAAEPHHLACG